MSSPAIVLDRVSKKYGDVPAVHDLSMSIGQGEMFGLIGPDGAGKTTTIRVMCGLLHVDDGSVRVLGLDPAKDHRQVTQSVGYLSQRFSLYGDLTVDENIEFFAEIHGVRDYKPRRNELLEFTRLTPFRSRLADKLSGGMKQKLALACTLVHTPELIFLDEPTTGVDPVSRRDFWKVLSNLLKSGITIVMTTPYLDEAERCTHVALMNQGSILVADTPLNVKKVMKGTIVEIVCNEIRPSFKLLRQFPLLREVQAFGDRLNIVVDNAERDVPKVLTHMAENGITVTDWRKIPPSLENVFISLLSDQSPQKESEVAAP